MENQQIVHCQFPNVAKPSEQPPGRPSSEPIFLSPSAFKMKLLRRIVAVDGGTIDKKSLKTLETKNSEKTMKASIIFPNGEVGTLISLEKIEKKKDSKEEDDRLFPSINESDYFDNTGLMHPQPRKEKPLRLPPISLPRIYELKPLPILPTDYNSLTIPPKPVTDEDWEDLKECRYLRPSPRKYRGSNDQRMP